MIKNWECGSKKQNAGIVAITLFSILLMYPAVVVLVRADNINPGVFAIDSKPYGTSYADWTANWSKWLISIPQPGNPITDSTGKYCAQGQSGPVWFLPGTTGGAAERTCTIPAGKAVLFPVLNSECDYVSFPNVKSEPELVSCARADVNRGINQQATVDGVSLKQLGTYRITSPQYNFTYPAKNIFGAPQGPTQGVTDGYWVFLQPLSPGKHELHFSGETPGNPTTGTANFAVDVTYHLIFK
ncbi:MAG TPA: hypothetical protein VFI73_10645 [Candidatus Nitrosopolaris sp.]|nr:hypothetical protein [Candidatus Nitrosopolaris sp.]